MLMPTAADPGESIVRLAQHQQQQGGGGSVLAGYPAAAVRYLAELRWRVYVWGTLRMCVFCFVSVAGWLGD